MPVKRWQEVEAHILGRIASGDLPEGALLPADQKIAKKLKCSLQPVLRAMHHLAQRGVLDRRRGARSRVLWAPPAFAEGPPGLAADQRGRSPEQRLSDSLEFGFTYNSTQVFGSRLTTRLLEVTQRLPAPGPEGLAEGRAQRALSLGRQEPFYVIARLRILDDVPRVIHRAYLNPAHVPDGMIGDFDLANVSLLALYQEWGFSIEGRHTVLRARLPSPEERRLFRIVETEPILEAEQELQARRVSSGEVVTIEFLRASYLRWEYRIENRQPGPRRTSDVDSSPVRGTAKST